MECLDGVCSAGASFTVRKKRSSTSRKPCLGSWKFTEDFSVFPPSTVLLGSRCNDEDCYGERVVSPGGPRNENRPTKLKLKLGGIVHTIHAKSAVEYGLDGTSSVAKSSQCCDGPPLIKPSQYSRSERHWSSTGKMPGGESEQVSKRRVIDSEFDPAYRTRKLGFVVGSSEAIQSTNLEFPDGLPPAPPKKGKQKLSEVEKQLKKAEASQRRKTQSEKAAQEAEAEAIRKIRGHDGAKKKKEEKIKMKLKEKAAKGDMLGPNTIRWIIGPGGSVVIFSDDIGLPKLFNSVPYSYPPPREKCAGPDCSNTYKYRDSESKLPLCSLRCYKAIHGKMQAMITC